MIRERELLWDGCVNVRDLGGLPTEDGREARFGAVIRADDLSGLTQAGWEALAGYRISRIIDLRHERDRGLYESDAELVEVPLLDDPGLVEIDELLAAVDDPVEWRTRNYLFFLDRYLDRFARAVGMVASAPPGAVLVHCAGGVDRTGLVAALLLRVAGVGVETIAEDYAESERNWSQWADEWVGDAPDRAERRKRRLLSVMPAAAMHGVLVELEERYRGVSGYLNAGGAGNDDLRRIRVRLREDDGAS